ncbi:DDE superfamily endonuclease [Nitzschia inconspicua]|uniref:DDE superfamily endonuclease n=1 Tax=Nitzschia inconspicua TaxID=303405 RepID=A0A9K3Q5V3_9STRA|nr:DDE superfamily endonuclease [Nitzschia inconspicua]
MSFVAFVLEMQRKRKKRDEINAARKKRLRKFQLMAAFQSMEPPLAKITTGLNEKKERSQIAPRRSKGVILYRDEVDGQLKPMPPTMSSWYNLYCAEHCAELTPNFEAKFRRRFRLPYSEFQNLVDLCKQDSTSENGYFKRWRPGTAAADGKPGSPIELLVLTALRYLGRGWTFDDLEEATAISEEVIRNFFHQFIHWGSERLYVDYVRSPETIPEAASTVLEYSQAGFSGCVGSMDASHVEHSRISHSHRQAHLSFKLPFTARTYNLVCNHRRRIFCTTEGHPARWNDKSLVRFDKLATGLHEGTHPLCDLPFELYAYGENGEIVKQKYKGGWLLVDNGYLNWGVTIPPMKEAATMREWRFSKWLESMRKDVECTFGILKGRWRILKAGIRVHGTVAADRIWKTCCALHNLLLEVDGIAEDFTSDWLGEMGKFSISELPEPVRRLLGNNCSIQQYDASGMGAGVDATRSPEEEEIGFVGSVVEEGGAIVVRRMHMTLFRERLIEHFDICFPRNELAWPRQRMMGAAEPNLE